MSWGCLLLRLRWRKQPENRKPEEVKQVKDGFGKFFETALFFTSQPIMDYSILKVFSCQLSAVST
jgi:hypothetical protein